MATLQLLLELVVELVLLQAIHLGGFILKTLLELFIRGKVLDLD